MIRFVQSTTGEVFRVLKEIDNGLWLIAYQEPAAPIFAASAVGLDRIETPAQFLDAQQRPLTLAEQKRLTLIQPLLDDEGCITDKGHRLSMAKDISASSGTTIKRVLRIYYRYLAKGELGSHPGRESKRRPEFDWAIQRFYFSAKRLSLRAAYDMLLVQKYTDSNGQIKKDAPSWNSFSRYYYAQGYHKKPERIIARDGLTHYQRNHRPAFGSASDWRPQPGAYQMDATEKGSYVVSQMSGSSPTRCKLYVSIGKLSEEVDFVTASSGWISFRYSGSRAAKGGLSPEKNKEFCLTSTFQKTASFV